MINIGKIHIHGFGSILTKLKYKFGRPGLNSIHGINGAGKTTIFNALCWCLYGELLKKGMTVQPWAHTTPEDFKGTMVEVDINDHVIIRCLDYKGKIEGKKGANGLFIFKEGKLLPIKSKPEAQKYIIEFLGYSFNLFKNSILFGQEMKRLMEEDGPTRKKVLEEAFEITFITKAKELAEQKLILNQNIWNTERDKVEVLKEKVSDLQRDIADEIENKKTFEDDKAERIKVLEQKIRQVKKKFVFLLSQDDLPKKIEDKKALIEKMEKKLKPEYVNEEFKLMLEHTQIADRVQGYINAMSLYQRSMQNKTCPQCGGKISLEKIRAEYNKAKKAKAEAMEEAQHKMREWNEAKDKLQSQESIKKGISLLKYDLKLLETALKNAQENLRQAELNARDIKSYKAQIEEIKNTKAKFNIKAKKEKLYKLINERDEKEMELKPTTKTIENLKWVIKDPLSNSGLKAYIFDTMLRKVNHYLKNYAKDIGFEVKVYIDMDSANKNVEIEILRGAPINYYDLSKGQKQLVNVVLIFALNDVITASKPLNMLIIDEVFESLSDDNVEIVSNIIERKAKTKSIHLITHHSKFNPVHCYKTFLTYDLKEGTKLHTKYRDQ